MKKVKILLTMAAIAFSVMLCGTLNAFALTEGDWEFQLLDNEAEITNYLGDDADVIIPETLYGVPVTRVTGSNDHYFRRARSITYPKTVKVIEEVVCDRSSENAALENVILPEGIEEIGEQAFASCKNLKSIKIPSTVKKIDTYAFENCTSLASVNFPDGLESIGFLAFSGTALTELDLSHINPEYRSSVFSYCKSLKSVKLNNGIVEIPEAMFRKCTSLESVYIPNSVTKICQYAFEDCTSLKEIILPTSLKELESSCFASSGLIEVVIPYGTKYISSFWAAFRYCQNLKSVYIPDTTKMDGNIISGCPNAIIYCTANSKAAEVCKDQKISYLTDNSVNSGITVLYNGTRVSFHSYGQNPELLNSRTLVPLRSIFEAMGANVKWDEATSTAVAVRNGIEIKIQIGANEMYKNGKAVSVDVPAMLLNDRTMVPVRVIAEAFGASVEWNGNGNTVLITE